MATAFKQVKNGSKSTLASGITNSATSLTVQTGHGSRFPIPGNTYWMTIWNKASYPDPRDDPNGEIVLVTARSSDTFTVTRGQVNTAGVSHASGDAVEMLLLDQHFNDITTAVNTVESASGAQSFAEKPSTGSRTYLDRREVASAFSYGDGFGGVTQNKEKVFVLSEVSGKAGIIKNIWHAVAGPDNNSYERGISMRIFIDNGSTPVCDVPLSSFFGYEHKTAKFDNKMHGRTQKDDVGHTSGAYRYLFIPFQEYMRVEMVYNDTTANSANYWTQVAWTSLDTPYTGLKKSWRMAGALATSQAPYAVLNAVDVSGAGQLEYLSIGWQLYGETYPFYAYEGNVKVTVDSETRPAWMTTGGEDLPSGAFGLSPVGGYPGGMPGTSSETDTQTFYRWFDADPVYFNTRLQTSYQLGQPGQPTLTPTGTGDVWSYASYWLDQYATPVYKKLGSTIVSETFAYSSGALPSPWTNNPVGTTVTANGSGLAQVLSASTADVGSTRTKTDVVGGASNYWVEVEARITGTNGVDAPEVLLMGRKEYNAGAFATAAAVELKKIDTHNWAIVAREDFGTIASVKIDGGADLTNVWIKLGMKVEGATCTAYWKFADDPNPMQAFAKWTNGWNGANIGIGSWYAQADYRNFKTQALI